MDKLMDILFIIGAGIVSITTILFAIILAFIPIAVIPFTIWLVWYLFVNTA